MNVSLSAARGPAGLHITAQGEQTGAVLEGNSPREGEMRGSATCACPFKRQERCKSACRDARVFNHINLITQPKQSKRCNRVFFVQIFLLSKIYLYYMYKKNRSSVYKFSPSITNVNKAMDIFFKKLNQVKWMRNITESLNMTHTQKKKKTRPFICGNSSREIKIFV